MNLFLCLFATGLYLCLQAQVHADSGLSREMIEEAVISAKAIVDSAYMYSRRVSLERVRRDTATPSDILRAEKQPKGPTRSAVRAADYMDNAIRLLHSSNHARRMRRSINATDLLTEEDLGVIAELTGCSIRQRPPSCRTTPNLDEFRTASSVCNNRENTRWGSSNIPFTRWLPAEYQDDISLPKGWDRDEKVNGFILPLVREVSNRILSTADKDVESDPLYTHLVTIFGQWTDHDLTFTPHSPVIRSFSNGIDCDKSCERTEPCFPIEIPPNDPRFGSNSDACIPFFRSSAACGSGKNGYIFGAGTVREQMNSLTAFIDAGQVYGSDDTKAQLLRDLSNDQGLLRVNKMYKDKDQDMLPFSNGTNMCATRRKQTKDDSVEEVPCFLGGDERANENIALASLHTLFMREHNRLARALAKINPSWDGERLYQEARKILGAMLQVITFRDYLPHIVGPAHMSQYLSSYPGYDELVDPGIANVFATAAYRFAHAAVQLLISRLGEDYEEHPEFPSIPLHQSFFSSWRLIHQGGVDPVMRGLIGRRAKLNVQDAIMHDELREMLFKFTSRLALDLASLNLQRGRDHGLPGYNKWRKFCGLSQPQNLVELAEVLGNEELAQKLLALYGTPENIDVWIGGLAEPFVEGGRVGPLFACIIARQFQKIRQGDRLWWEKDGVFTEAQRGSLMKTSLAQIICDNTGITTVPGEPFLFRPASGYTHCSSLSGFDLEPWNEDRENSNNPHDPFEMPSWIPGPRGPPGPPGPRGPPGPPANSSHVAFSLQLGNDVENPVNPIKFFKVSYNAQGSYDLHTGKFICSVPGVYHFSFTCMGRPAKFSVDLMHNNKAVFHSFNVFQNRYSVASGDMYIEVKEGDAVWLSASENTKGLYRNSMFSGNLLF